MQGIAAQNADVLQGGRQIDLGLVFGILGQLKFLLGNRSFLVQPLGALKLLLREQFAGLELLHL